MVRSGFRYAAPRKDHARLGTLDECEQSERSNPRRAEIVGRSSTSQRRTSENTEPERVDPGFLSLRSN